MQKSILFTAAMTLCSIVTFSAPSFADNSDALMASSNGIHMGTTDMDARYPVDPRTGKRPGIIDWNGTGRDISEHSHGERHDAKLCGICG